MPVQLLPASAAAFAPRAASVNVVLGSKIEPWLTQTLKRINRVKRPLNSVPQHQRCLTETLSNPNAIWTLTSIMLPKTPEADFKKDNNNPLVEAITNYQLIHVEAYIVHVDMVLRNEVAYKLTTDSIDALVDYHKEIFCVDAKAATYDWSEKEQQCKKLHEDFIQAINKYVFRTHVSALEGLEEEGAGELLCGKSEEVKNAIANLMKPLLPPPPRVIDVVRQAPLLPSSPVNHMWAQPTLPSNALPAVDAWRVLPSSPSVTSSVDSNTSPIWAPMGMTDVQLSPTPAYTQPHSTAGFFYSTPQVTAPIPAPLPLPSMLAPAQCGVSMGMAMGGGMGGMGGYNPMSSMAGMGMGGMGGFGGWDRYQEYATIM